MLAGDESIGSDAGIARYSTAIRHLPSATCQLPSLCAIAEEPHVWYRRLHRPAERGPDHHGRLAAAGISRLRLGRHRRHPGRQHRHPARRRQAEQPGGQAGRSAIEGNIGIGHTRWATHGKPSERNAHPHADASGQLVVVQNGIVENFRELRAELEAEGIAFQSDTDTEVIAHLVGLHYSGRPAAGRGGAPGAAPTARPQRHRRRCRSVSRTRWWRPGWAMPAASRSASATARCSSPPTCRPSWSTPGAWSSWRTARWRW